MEIAVLSGKGGTGKTTVSLNMARAAGETELFDCDVEEPNGHIFLKPEVVEEKRVAIEIPEIDREKCTNCGACARFCRFNCFISSPSLTIVMPELCHSCGGCEMVCEAGAISYKTRETGSILRGKTGQINLSWGLLDVGELSGVKIIGELRRGEPSTALRITDCPPGTACSTVEAVENADFALLVAEPTPFGISDMLMVAAMLKALEVPTGLVINKAGLGDDKLKEVCRKEGIPILGEIPFSREAASIYARGGLLYDESEALRSLFDQLLENVQNKAEEAVEEKKQRQDVK